MERWGRWIDQNPVRGAIPSPRFFAWSLYSAFEKPCLVDVTSRATDRQG